MSIDQHFEPPRGFVKASSTSPLRFLRHIADLALTYAPLFYSFMLLFGPVIASAAIAAMFRINSHAFLPTSDNPANASCHAKAIAVALDVGIPGRGHAPSLNSLLGEYEQPRRYDTIITSHANCSLYSELMRRLPSKYRGPSDGSGDVPPQLVDKSPDFVRDNEFAYLQLSALITRSHDSEGTRSWLTKFKLEVADLPYWKAMPDKSELNAISGNDSTTSTLLLPPIHAWNDWPLRANHEWRLGHIHDSDGESLKALRAYESASNIVHCALGYEKEMGVASGVHATSAIGFLADTAIRRARLLQKRGHYSVAVRILTSTYNDICNYSKRFVEDKATNRPGQKHSTIDNLPIKIATAALKTHIAWLEFDQFAFAPGDITQRHVGHKFTDDIGAINANENMNLDEMRCVACRDGFLRSGTQGNEVAAITAERCVFYFGELEKQLSQIGDQISSLRNNASDNAMKSHWEAVLLDLTLWNLHCQHGRALALAAIPVVSDTTHLIDSVTILKGVEEKLKTLLNNSTYSTSQRHNIVLRLANTLDRKGDMYLFWPIGEIDDNPCGVIDALSAYDSALRMSLQQMTYSDDKGQLYAIASAIARKRNIAAILTGEADVVIEMKKHPSGVYSHNVEEYLDTLNMIYTFSVKAKPNQPTNSPDPSQLLASRIVSRLYASDIYNRFGRDERRALLWAAQMADVKPLLPNDFIVSDE